VAQVSNNLIGGQWVEGGSTVENRNPSDLSDVIGLYAQAEQSQLNDAVSAARAAMPGWRAVGLEARQTMLDTIGREMMARAEELGTLLSREEGKPIAEGKGEVYRAGQFFTYYAAEVLRQLGENADSTRPNIEIDVRREPMGVVAVISPWNFPTATASWKIAPALAYGNSVIWKPANQTPASAWALAEIISRAGLPEGAFQLLMGSGSSIGNELVAHKGVDAVTFTGSYQVGREVAIAAASNLTKVQLELGSKNALVVMDDADIDLAVAAATAGGYSGSGQKCTASSRLLVHAAVHDEFVEKLGKSVSALKVGHALDAGTQLGPDGYEQGLATANDTDYGLVAGIFTRSLARATHFRRHAETGCVMINLPTAGTDYHVPFGGRKNSSMGPREQGRGAAEFYTQMKTAYSLSGDPE